MESNIQGIWHLYEHNLMTFWCFCHCKDSWESGSIEGWDLWDQILGLSWTPLVHQAGKVPGCLFGRISGGLDRSDVHVGGRSPHMDDWTFGDASCYSKLFRCKQNQAILWHCFITAVVLYLPTNWNHFCTTLSILCVQTYWYFTKLLGFKNFLLA